MLCSIFKHVAVHISQKKSAMVIINNNNNNNNMYNNNKQLKCVFSIVNR